MSNLTIQRGECVLVVGPNGAGKSLLLRAAAGEAHTLAAGARHVGPGVSMFVFGQDAAELLAGKETAAETLRAELKAAREAAAAAHDADARRRRRGVRPPPSSCTAGWGVPRFEREPGVAPRLAHSPCGSRRAGQTGPRHGPRQLSR